MKGHFLFTDSLGKLKVKFTILKFENIKIGIVGKNWGDRDTSSEMRAVNFDSVIKTKDL